MDKRSCMHHTILIDKVAQSLPHLIHLRIKAILLSLWCSGVGGFQSDVHCQLFKMANLFHQIKHQTDHCLSSTYQVDKEQSHAKWSNFLYVHEIISYGAEYCEDLTGESEAVRCVLVVY